MKRRLVFLFSIIFMLVMFQGQMAVFANTDRQVFKDVNQTHWAYSAIQNGVQNGLISGYPDGTFRPNQAVTTAEFVAILVRSYGKGEQIPKGGNFNDNIAKYMKQVSYPYSNQPSKKITRAEVATLIAQSNGLPYTGDDAIKFLLVNHLAKGKVAGGLPTIVNYQGNDLLTRAEAVTFVQNIQKQGLNGSKSPQNLAKFITDLTEINREYLIISQSPLSNYVVFGNINELNQTEIEIFVLTNEERIRNGRKPLALDVELSKIARIKSKDMHDKQYFAHISPTYGSPFDMLEQFNIDYRIAAENIAAGYKDAQEVTNGWINSPGHHRNMIHQELERIGIGYYEGPNGYKKYYTQLFITK